MTAPDIFAKPRAPAPDWIGTSMNQIARIMPASTVALKAWTVSSIKDGNWLNEAVRRELPEWAETTDEAALAVCQAAGARSIMILRSDASERPERRHLLHVYTVRKRSQRGYVRGPDGLPTREPAEYPDLQMKVCVGEGFAPSEPFEYRGDAVGNDKTLVEIQG